jgi:hypothetical protein
MVSMLTAVDGLYGAVSAGLALPTHSVRLVRLQHPNTSISLEGLSEVIGVVGSLITSFPSLIADLVNLRPLSRARRAEFRVREASARADEEEARQALLTDRTELEREQIQLEKLQVELQRARLERESAEFEVRMLGLETERSAMLTEIQAAVAETAAVPPDLRPRLLVELLRQGGAGLFAPPEPFMASVVQSTT